MFFEKDKMPSEADLLDALTHSNPNESGPKEKEILGQTINEQGGQDLFIPSDEGEAFFKQKQEERRRKEFSYYPLPDKISEEDALNYDDELICKQAYNLLGIEKDDKDYFDEEGNVKSAEAKISLLQALNDATIAGYPMTFDKGAFKRVILELIDRPVLKVFMYLKLKGIRTTDAGGFKNNCEINIEVDGKIRPYGVT